MTVVSGGHDEQRPLADLTGSAGSDPTHREGGKASGSRHSESLNTISLCTRDVHRFETQDVAWLTRQVLADLFQRANPDAAHFALP